MDVTSSDVLAGSNYNISLLYVSPPLTALELPYHLHPPLSTVYTALLFLIWYIEIWYIEIWYIQIWYIEISDLLSNFILLTVFVLGLH
jgi:hypothetical protein